MGLGLTGRYSLDARRRGVNGILLLLSEGVLLLNKRKLVADSFHKEAVLLHVNRVRIVLHSILLFVAAAAAAVAIIVIASFAARTV